MEPLRVITRRSFLTATGLAAAGLLAARYLKGGPPDGAAAARPLRADDLLVEDAGDGVVLTPRAAGPGSGSRPLFRLNGAAALVWRAADGRHSADEIAARLAAAYSLPRQTARRDTERCLATLARAGLVTAAGG